MKRESSILNLPRLKVADDLPDVDGRRALYHAAAASHASGGLPVFDAVVKLVKNSLLQARNRFTPGVMPGGLLREGGEHAGVPVTKTASPPEAPRVNHGKAAANGADKGADSASQTGIGKGSPIGIVAPGLDGLAEGIKIDRCSRLKRAFFFNSFDSAEGFIIPGLEKRFVRRQKLPSPLCENTEAVGLLERNDLNIHPGRIEGTAAHPVAEAGGGRGYASHSDEAEPFPSLTVVGVGDRPIQEDGVEGVEGANVATPDSEGHERSFRKLGG